VKKGLSGMFGSSAAQKAQVTEEKFVQSRAQLEQRVSVVEQGLGRLGVRTIPLGTDELVELYYHIFNPEDLSSAPQRA
jgi:hypothetical protein